MRRFGIVLFALAAYLAGFVTLLYLIVWLFPFPWMPTTIDRGLLPPARSIGGVLWDLGLIALFGIQHSLMVRPRIKTAIERFIPSPALRAVYTLASSITLAALLALWRPLPQPIWDFPSGWGYWIFTLLYGFGWTVAFLATFQIDHFELFGLRQAWRHLRGEPEPHPAFVERGFYRFVRHPIQAGTLLGIWATPRMSVGHLIFALAFTVYVLIGLRYEERDLTRTLGEEYARYRTRVGMLLPKIRK
ncbi:methyltransferase family protein [Nitratifractor sp.]